MYRRVLEGSFKVVDTGVRLSIPVGFHSHPAEIWRTEDEDPVTYFVRRDEYFDRSQLYSLSNRDYDDNFARFVFFQKAVVAMIDTLGLAPDVVHGNDWQTGLLPLFLEHGIHGVGRGRKEKTVFTIHNLAYQGLFSGNDFSDTNLPFPSFSVDTMEFYGNINCMKNGIICSDAVTTVSRTYAQEIQTEAYGSGLHGVLQKCKGKLTGIVNGVDYDAWNPADDPHIAAPYSADDLSGKAKCRAQLVRKLGVILKPRAPLVGMISRLVDQKGMDILAEAMPELMKLDIGFVLLGTGQQAYHELCTSWAEQWPGRFICRLAFDQELAHQIEAGSDVFLMPSHFEPCGLNQMYSLRYGTVPVVHATGGLIDTVQNIDPSGAKGDGFQFTPYSAPSLVEAVNRGVTLFKRKATWQSIMARGMSRDFSWDRAAAEYEAVYASLIV
jgi:starch synthase